MSSTHLFDAPGPKTIRRMVIGSILAGIAILAIVIYVLIQLAATGQLAADKWLPFVTNIELLEFLGIGLLNTIEAAVVALTLALVLGVCLGVGRLSPLKLINIPCTAVIEFFRAAPVLLSMLFFFLAFPLVFGIDVSAFWTVVLALTLYNGTVIAEIVRAGVLTLPSGQREAASALGLSWWQTTRLILLPQALRIMLPALVSQMVTLIKDSSLGFIIGYQELTKHAQSAALLFSNPLQTYIVVAVVYIIINSILSEVSAYVSERQKKSGTRQDDTVAEIGFGG